MIVKLCFKTPDVMADSVRSAVIDQMEHDGYDPMDEGFEDTRDRLMLPVMASLERFIKYGEYCWLEYDTETDTLTPKCL